ncbi:hypothetical protein BJV77DRAFT_728589 [Russula vinacea]|nr:hypothetical protein BJV77DRAFT_728589 [Russula vinacea]
MVNFHDPILTPQLGFAFVKLWHVLAGIFLWEFITTLDYEWRVFRGHLPYRWTIWVYSLARVSCLVGLIFNLVGMDTTTRLNCQLWISFVASLLCLSQGCASLLIVLRTIAIWNRNKAARLATISIWGIGIGFHIQYVARLRSVWNPAELSCLSVTTKRDLLGLIPSIVMDMILILIMLVGLIILGRNGSSSFGLTPLIIKQGIIWLTLGFLSEAPGAVIAMMSSNDQFIDMLLTPGTITMIITATRMHRYLVDFAFGSPNGYDTLNFLSFLFCSAPVISF